MRVVYPLYYGESISKKKQKKLCRQLEKHQFAKNKEYYIIVLYHDKATFFEKISIKEYEMQCALGKNFDVLGLVKNDEEFQEFTVQIMELLIGKAKEISKKELINYYKEKDYEDIKI